MNICEYGCNQEAKYQFKNGKWCCSRNQTLCPNIRNKIREKNKGKKFSEEHRKKISESSRGKKISEEIKERLRNNWKGRKHSEESKKKISEANKGINNPNYGKILSYETKQKISEKMKGKNHPFFEKSHTEETKQKISEKMKGENHPCYGKHLSEETRKKISESNKGKKRSKECIAKMRNRMIGNGFPDFVYKNRIRTIEKIKEKYPLFSRIEEMRYNPDNPDEYEIQVRCKNHNCINSKEKEGWFTPTGIQLYERIRQIESVDGNGGCYFYCSDECKNKCPLYRLQRDPFSVQTEKPYTNSEYQTFRQTVLKRDNYICQYCGKLAEHVHHERPQKLEPFFSLDPDLAWSVCKECHYKRSHIDECSTGNLAKKNC